MVLGFQVPAWASLPHFSFLENKGQWDAQTLYRANLPDGYLFLHAQSVTYGFYDGHTLRELHTQKPDDGKEKKMAPVMPRQIPAHGYRVHFEGANPRPIIQGKDQYPTRYHFLLGDGARHARGVNAFQEVYYKALYPSVDLRYYLNDLDLKYDFIVHPGADPSQIVLRYEGITGMELKHGHLHVHTSINSLIEYKPYCYQLIEGKEVEVPSTFVLEGQNLTYAFPEGYDPAHALIIDPVLVFSTFSGSISDNWGFTATHDPQGRLYAGGIVFGADFPATVGAFQVNFSNATDVSIQRYNANGSALEFATFLGGGFAEVPQSMIVNNMGDLVVIGATSSPNFPTSIQGYSRVFQGGNPFREEVPGIVFENGTDLFVTVLDSTGGILKGGTFMGGSFDDGINDTNNQGVITRNYGDEFRGEVIVSPNNDILVVSTSRSGNFPVTPGAFRTQNQGGQDVVVFKLSPNCSQLIWSTYLGGLGFEAGYGIRENRAGEVIVVGITGSTNFPTTSSALNPLFRGGRSDGFVAVLSGDGSTLRAGTYLGTNSDDQVLLVDLDPNEQITVIGQTVGSYPVSPGTFQVQGSGQFIHQLSPNLAETRFSTIVGSSNRRISFSPTAFLVNECGNIYLSGWGGQLNNFPNYSWGSTFGLPTTSDAFQTQTDGRDFYLMILERNATSLLYGSFFGSTDGGGEHVDGGTSRFDRRGIVYQSVCSCGQSNFPTTPGAYDRENNSVGPTGAIRCNNAAFKFDLKTIAADFRTSARRGCAPLNVTFTNQSQGGRNFEWRLNGQVVSTSNTTYTTRFEQPGTYVVSLSSSDPENCFISGAVTDTIVVGTQEFATSGPVTICEGETVEIFASGAETYFWLPNTGISNPSLSTQTVAPVRSTNYIVRMVNAFGCEVDSIINVTVVPSPVVNFEAQVITGCDSIQTVNLVNRSANVLNYRWEISDGRILEVQEPGILRFDSPGEYTITLKGDNFGCRAEQTATVTIAPIPSFFFFENVTVSDPPILCEGQEVSLLAQGGTRYSWTPANGLNNPNIANPVARPRQTTSYTVRVFNENDCFVDKEVVVTVVPDIFLDFRVDASQNCEEFPEFTFQAINDPAGELIWEFSDGRTLTGNNTGTVIFPVTGEYVVRLISLREGCEQITEKKVLSEKVVPGNVITPNRDGKNDRFIIQSQLRGWKFAVYNRWGEELFSHDDYHDQWGGEELAKGVYFYILTSPNGLVCRGWVHIL